MQLHQSRQRKVRLQVSSLMHGHRVLPDPEVAFAFAFALRGRPSVRAQNEKTHQKHPRHRRQDTRQSPDFR